MTGPNDQSRDHRRGSKLRPLLLPALLVCGVFAAWQMHKAFFAERRGATRITNFGARARVETEPADEGYSSLGELFSDPLEAEGIETLDRDPADLPPPAGARRILAVRFTRSGYVTEQASYDVPGSPDEVLGHYENAMGQVNLKPTGEDKVDERSVTRCFACGQSFASVSLLEGDAGDKMMRVIVNVQTPAD